MNSNRFAYLFGRFPSFTQTFCFREAAEMTRQCARPPLIFSIRKEESAQNYSPKLEVIYLPHISRFQRLKMRWGAPRQIRRELPRWSAKGDLARFYNACWIAPVLRREKVRHVHAHFVGMAARTAWWLKKLHGISYSFTGHANDLFCETDHPISLEELVREASFVATETEFSRDWLRKKFPAHAEKMHRIFNGIDVSQFTAKPLGQTISGRPLILSVGRLIEKKGFADLISACAILRGRGVDFECRIVGDGSLREVLSEQIARENLSDVVFLEGAKTQREIAPLFARAAVFALACTREADGGMDNLPTVIAEAMACALPVVSTRIAGVPEMVVDGASGFLVSEKNPGELAGAIEKIFVDRARAELFGKCGREIAGEKFAIEKTTKQLRELIESVIA